jgi:hypothetical protein
MMSFNYLIIPKLINFVSTLIKDLGWSKKKALEIKFFLALFKEAKLQIELARIAAYLTEVLAVPQAGVVVPVVATEAAPIVSF